MIFDEYEVERTLQTLTVREERIMRMRYGIGHEQVKVSDIAAHFAVSKQQIYRILTRLTEKKIPRLLRHEWRIEDFLG